MAASKAGINSQSGERLGALESTGLTGTTVAEQLAELKLLIEESGGGVFKLLSLQSGVVAAGASGAILTKNITDVPGATHIKITTLTSSNNTANETGVTLTTENGVVLAGDLADNSAPTADIASSVFGISDKYATTATINSYGRIIDGLYCSQFTLSKDAGVTTNGIQWVIQYGVVE